MKDTYLFILLMAVLLPCAYSYGERKGRRTQRSITHKFRQAVSHAEK